VKRGGMKKKFQINALSAADIKTGKMSNETASMETVNKSIKAVTRYPINSDRTKHIPETRITVVIPNKY
jgi:hypothetical protein